jgi:hypothetical protein
VRASVSRPCRLFTSACRHLGYFRFLSPRQRWVSRPVLEFLSAVLAVEPDTPPPRRPTRTLDGFTVDVDRPEIGFKLVDASEVVRTGDAVDAEASAGMLKGL